MAPIQKKRPSLRAKAHPARPSTTLKPRTSFPTADSTFSTTKKDKRIVKHSTFINKISKANSTPKKRRRPSNKLVTTLSSLADALPAADDAGAADGGERVVGQARIRHKSLRSRPGAMKRKEKLEAMERERFEKNMAQMVGGAQAQAKVPGAEEKAGDGASARWAALRGFIEATMEKKPEFQRRE